MREIEVISEEDVLRDYVRGVASHELEDVDGLLPLSIVILIRQDQYLFKRQLAGLGLLHRLRRRLVVQFVIFIFKAIIDGKGHIGRCILNMM